MNLVCLDLEGVLVPEIWVAFAEATGIPELKRTTRDEPDYDKLMAFRLGLLKERGLGLREIQATIAGIDPLPGAKEFLDELRAMAQVVIISDTFEQFAQPLMEKLGWPTIFCNTLVVAPDGEITGFEMRCPQSKLTTVRALQSCGFDTIAAGDSSGAPRPSSPTIRNSRRSKTTPTCWPPSSATSDGEPCAGRCARKPTRHSRPGNVLESVRCEKS